MITMRKVRLNCGFSREQSIDLLEKMQYIGKCVDAVEMFISAPGPNVQDAVKQALKEIQTALIDVMQYVGMSSVNSAKLQVGGQHNDVDSEFMEEADSILGLDDGQSVDISKARLLYNEDTMELMLTDEPETPDGFELVGTVQEAADTDEATDNDGEELVHEESAEDDKEPEDKEPSESEPESPERESEEPPRKEPEF